SGIQRGALPTGLPGERLAFDARVADHGHWVGGIEEAADAVVECGELDTLRRAAPAQAHFAAQPALGLQIGIAEAREVQLVEGWCDEAAAPAGGDTPRRAEVESVAQRTGGGATKLRVVVAPGVDLPVMRSRLAAQAQQQRPDGALIDGV